MRKASPVLAFPVFSLLALAACSSTGKTAEDADVASEEALTRQCSSKIPDPKAGAVQGIDVSHHDGTVDWDTVVAKNPRIKFAVARISDGLTHVDGDIFSTNYAEIQRVGLIRGAYQFLRPNESAEDQANLFVQTLTDAGGYQPGDFPPTVDIEVSGSSATEVQEAVRTWLSIVQAAFNVRPMIYSLAGESDYLGGCFTELPLWIANFYQKCPKMPTAWTAKNIPWTFFQYVDNTHPKGFAAGTDVDMEVFNGTQEEFEQFIADTSALGSQPITLSTSRCKIH